MLIIQSYVQISNLLKLQKLIISTNAWHPSLPPVFSVSRIPSEIMKYFMLRSEYASILASFWFPHFLAFVLLSDDIIFFETDLMLIQSKTIINSSVIGNYFADAYCAAVPPTVRIAALLVQTTIEILTKNPIRNKLPTLWIKMPKFTIRCYSQR